MTKTICQRRGHHVWGLGRRKPASKERMLSCRACGAEIDPGRSTIHVYETRCGRVNPNGKVRP